MEDIGFDVSASADRVSYQIRVTSANPAQGALAKEFSSNLEGVAYHPSGNPFEHGRARHLQMLDAAAVAFATNMLSMVSSGTYEIERTIYVDSGSAQRDLTPIVGP